MSESNYYMKTTQYKTESSTYNISNAGSSSASKLIKLPINIYDTILIFYGRVFVTFLTSSIFEIELGRTFRGSMT